MVGNVSDENKIIAIKQIINIVIFFDSTISCPINVMALIKLVIQKKKQSNVYNKVVAAKYYEEVLREE